MALMTRRQLLAGMAAAAPLAAQGRRGNGPRIRTTPPVCLYSQVLVKVEYQDLGAVLNGLGFDACDLSVQPGGHVAPAQAPADLMRAVEALTGVGIDVPMITTAATNMRSPDDRNVLAIVGEMGVPYFRPGYWRYADAPDMDARLVQVQRDLAELVSIGRALNMQMGVHNRMGDYFGAAIWDTQMVIRAFDAKTAGYDYDIGYATATGGTEGWPITLRLVLPRLKMVTVRDFTWKDGKPVPCPLGEGVVDWRSFFAALAKAKFTGPISLQVDHQPANQLQAIKQDLAFVGKQLTAAYGG
jgi:sugar phosphate isomerase/epimerase